MDNGRITLASELPTPRPRSRVLSALRRARLLALSDDTMASLLRIPRVQVLCMHHVFDDEAAEFRLLVDGLARTHELTTVAQACERLAAGISRPVACITFDDGFANQALAAEIVRERGGSATFFVCTDPLEATERGRDEFCIRGLRRPPIAMLDWNGVERLLRDGHEIGCHTASHPVLSGLSAARLQDEIGRSAGLLRSRIGAVESFAWPFGRLEHIDAAARRAVADAGFLRALSAVRGCHTAPVGGVRDEYMARFPAEPMHGHRWIMKAVALAARTRGPFCWEEPDA
ncbi:MAG: polysaccharide deacetylase family protein [Phycisphaerales bacterium]